MDLDFLRFDLWVMFACSVMLWIFVLMRGTIGKGWGVAFLTGYFGYMFIIY